MRETIFLIIFVGFILVICFKIYSEDEMFNLKCIIATKDGNKYCVRDRTPDKIKESANLLATVTANCAAFVKYMKHKHPDDERVKRLVNGFNPTKISETLPTSELTAYSENKGEKIAFCLSKTKHSSTLIDIHTLTFVALHELTHIATSSIGHKQEFWQNYKFFLENAKDAGIYDPVDYKKSPQNYCGMTINDNPYYDM